MSNLSNTSAFAMAAASFKRGDVENQKGAGFLIEGFMDVLKRDAPLFAKVKRGKTVTTVEFRLADYFTPVYQSNGKQDGKLKSAKTDAVIDLIGTDTPTIRVGISKYLPAAIWLARDPDVKTVKGALHGILATEACDIFDTKGNLSANGKEVVKACMANASFSGKEIDETEALAILAKHRINLSVAETSRTWGKVPSVAGYAAMAKELAVAAGLVPAPIPKGADEANEEAEAASFTASVQWLTQVIGEQLSPEGEASVAISKDRLADLRCLHVALAAYLATEA